MKLPALLLGLCTVALFSCQCCAQEREATVRWTSDDRLTYQSDDQGDRIPDFSHCGYLASNEPIPQVKARVVVWPTGADEFLIYCEGRESAAIELPDDREYEWVGIDLRSGELQGSFAVAKNGRLMTSESPTVLWARAVSK